MGFISAATFFLVLAAAPCIAQESNGPVPRACGPLEASLAVNLDKSQHKIAEPEPGKALLYFIQDSGIENAGLMDWAYPTTKIGIDGKWVGANKRNSYFSIEIDPGEHHLCAQVQSGLLHHVIEIAHLTAEAGQTYFYRTRLIATRDGIEYLYLNPADIDEAQYLIESHPLAKAHLRQ